MCQLLETIKLENGELDNLSYHNQRLNAARAELFDLTEPINLEHSIIIPDNCKYGLFRCRIVYSREIETIEFIPQPSRTFSKLKLVTHDTIDYHLKFADRSVLNQLLSQREDADEVIIVKNGMITDCTTGNLVFFDGERWYTPSTPLLQGTQRQKLIDQELIIEAEIRKNDLKNYQKTGIINAFFDPDNMPIIKIENIF